MRNAMMKRVLAILLSAPLLSTGAAAGMDFDQGVDVKSVLAEIKGKLEVQGRLSGKNKRGRGAGRRGDGRRGGRRDEYTRGFDRTERDCATISVRHDDPLRSERILLESRTFEERCRTHVDRDGRERRDCREEWVHTERRQVRVEIIGRGEMLPWERDVFRVCLDGRWLNASVIDASHEYDLRVPGRYDDTIQALAGGKIRSLPDPAGVRVSAFSMDAPTGNFKMELVDRWADYYQGERLSVSVKLKRHRKFWFDETVIEKEVSFSGGRSHSIAFSDFITDLKGKLKPGAEYYVKWRFRRLGQVSKNGWVDYRETGRAAYEGELIKPLFFDDGEESYVDLAMRDAKR